MGKQSNCPGPVVMDDDGNAFLCMTCGTSARRTRDNPYPTMKHRGGSKLDAKDRSDG